MNRRDLLIAATAAALLPAAAARAGALAYEPGLVDRELAAGRTLFLVWTASWCPTCAAQDRVITALNAENPAYEEAITFIDIDWDRWKNDEITARFNVPRHSTLLAVKGDQEIGRLVAQTARAEIEALMDSALAAATA
jgi:thiol:disulfide interchange protein